MTAPVAHGYPDYGRYLAAADKLLVSDTQSNIDAVTTYPRMFVGDVPFMGIWLRVSTNHFRFNFDFYDAREGGNYLTGQPFSIRQGSEMDITIPVGGPFCEMSAQPSAVDGEFERTIWTAHSSNQYTRLSYDSLILASFNANINAGATQTISSSRVFAGEAHWFADSAAATWTARVETLDFQGTAVIIDEIRATAAGSDGRQIFLPPIDTQIVVVNSTGGGATFRTALVGRPIVPGR